MHKVSSVLQHYCSITAAKESIIYRWMHHEELFDVPLRMRLPTLNCILSARMVRGL